MLKGIGASGGTIYGSAITCSREEWVRVPAEADLTLFAVDDEAGEDGEVFEQHIPRCRYPVKAIAHIVNVAPGSSRGNTVRRAAEVLALPYTEVNVEQVTDVYQVQRTIKAVLEAQPFRERSSMIRKIMQTELLVLRHITERPGGSLRPALFRLHHAIGRKSQATHR